MHSRNKSCVFAGTVSRTHSGHYLPSKQPGTWVNKPGAGIVIPLLIIFLCFCPAGCLMSQRHIRTLRIPLRNILHTKSQHGFIRMPNYAWLCGALYISQSHCYFIKFQPIMSLLRFHAFSLVSGIFGTFSCQGV